MVSYDEQNNKFYCYGYGWRQWTPLDLNRTLKQASRTLHALVKVTGSQCIAFRGSSGTLMAFAYASEYDTVGLIHVRKDTDRSHGRAIECNYPNKITKYLIVDDFVSSGNTINHVYHKIASVDPGPECVGVFAWDYAGNNSDWDYAGNNSDWTTDLSADHVKIRQSVEDFTSPIIKSLPVYRMNKMGNIVGTHKGILPEMFIL